MKDRKSAVHLLIPVLGLWFLWSGPYSLPGFAKEGSFLILGSGFLASAGVVWFCRRLGIVDHDLVPLDLTLPTLRYVPWLAREVVRSNIDMVQRILGLGRSVDPQVIQVKASQKTDLGKVTYANSITLTPGTLTLDLEEDLLTVHAMDREAARELVEGEMDRRILRLEDS